MLKNVTKMFEKLKMLRKQSVYSYVVIKGM